MIYNIGIVRYVSVPEEACARFAPARTVPVVATVGGRTVRTTLVPAGRGNYRLALNSTQRKAAGVGAGDPVSVTFRLDTASHAVPTPRDFIAALRGAPAARKYFRAATRAQRLEVARYIEQAKAPQTRARRIANCVRVLGERWKKKSARAH